ncbi:MAG: hypothetical protein ACRDOY_05865 [Nocardioidaceae bacterium]
MRPRILVAGLVALALSVTACAVPQRKDTDIVTKPGASSASARSVVAEYSAVRQRADESLDGSLLADIEGGDLLAIDQGAYFVTVRVDIPGSYQGVQLQPPEQVFAPRFAEYPLWFVVVAHDPVRDTKRVAVFERTDSVSPWLMTMGPESSAEAALPPVLRDRTGAAVAVGPEDDSKTGVTPTEVLQRYAEALGPQSAAGASFAPDAFLAQTHRFQRTQQRLEFATFTQEWTAEAPDFALRCRGGGVLLFGTLTRADSYTVETDSFIDWEDNAEAAAYLPGRVYRTATLDYTHQVLMFVPPVGEGQPRLIGQYGGVVDGHGS